MSNQYRKKSPASSHIGNRLAPRLKIRSGIGSSLGIVMAAILFSQDFSDVVHQVNHEIQGKIIYDLNRDGIHNKEEHVISQAPLALYTDMNGNQNMDEEDQLISEVYSDARGNFQFDLKSVNTLFLQSRKIQEVVSWDKNKEQIFKFRLPKQAQRRNLKFAKLILTSHKKQSKFTNTEIIVPGNEKRKVYWGQKPWKKEKKYSSPNLVQILEPLFESETPNRFITLRLKMEEGKDAIEVKGQAELQLVFEDFEHDYLLTYVSNYDNEGNPLQQTKVLKRDSHEGIVLSYTGKPMNCTLVKNSGNVYQFNRFTGKGSSVYLADRKDMSFNEAFVSDPVSGGIFTYKDHRFFYLNPSIQKTVSLNIESSLCLNTGACIEAYAYHAIQDEIWILNKNRQLWKIPILRKDDSLVPALGIPRMLSDWGKEGIQISHSVERMAIMPEAGHIFLLGTSEVDQLVLSKLSLDSFTLQGTQSLKYKDVYLQSVTGFEHRDGENLWIMSQDPENEKHRIFTFHGEKNELSLSSEMEIIGKVNSCTCGSNAPFKIMMQVHDDRNQNSLRDSEERLLRNVRILAKPVENAGRTMQELKPDTKGNFVYRTFYAGKTRFELDENSLPEGFFISNISEMEIAHMGYGLGASFSGNLFQVAHASSSPNIKWEGIRGELIEDGSGVNLSWATSKEEGVRSFEVLRSQDGINYESVGGVEATGKTREMKEYVYRDYLIDDIESSIVAYRIKMRGGMGKTNFSPVTKIVIGKPDEGLALDVKVHASNESVMLSYQVMKPGPSEIRIMNLTGNVVKVIPVGVSQNGAEKLLDVTGWSRGLYYAQLRNGEKAVLKRWSLI